MEPSNVPAAATPSSRLSLDELTALALGRDPAFPSLAQLYFGVKGRIPRRTYWLHGVLSLILLGAVADALLVIANVDRGLAAIIADRALLWPLIAISVKRQHDYNFSGWWALLHFLQLLVPVAGSVVLMLVNGCVPGTHGPNRFGADPRAALARARLSSGH